MPNVFHDQQSFFQTRIPTGRSFSSSSATTATTPDDDTNQHRPHDVEDSSQQYRSARLLLDFFGEPVTFLGVPESDKKSTSNAMAAMDGFLLAAVSKGKSCTDGGDEAGLEVRPAHSAAVSWSEALRFATMWNQPDRVTSAPLLAVVTVAPVLAQTGVAYVKHLDSLLKHTKAIPGLPPIQMIDIATWAVSNKSNKSLNSRERMHLQLLECLLRDDHQKALVIATKILRLCPGDGLALSLAMDLAQTVGDKEYALRYVRAMCWSE